MSRPTQPSVYKDSRSSFGWLSIMLHWLCAMVVIALWFIGDGIATLEPEHVPARRNLHVSIGFSAYLLLWARIAWRLHSRHPRAPGQGRSTHRLAKSLHYVLLTAIAGMLCSGPVVLWSSSVGFSLFGLLDVQAGTATMPALNEAARSIHHFCGKAILWLTVLHIAAALKHLMFHDDETIARIFTPGQARATANPQLRNPKGI
jgi:cytochrome b561